MAPFETKSMSALAAGLLWNVILVAALAIVVALVVQLKVVRCRPALQHALWLLVLAKLVTPPLFSLPILATTAVDARSEPPADPSGAIAARLPEDHTITRTEVSGGATSRTGREATIVRERFNSRYLVLFGLWALGTTVVAAGSARQMARLSRLVQRAADADERIHRIANEAASLLKVRREPAVRVVDAAVTPMLCFCRREAIVILPRGLIRRLDDEEVRCVLMHEFAHHVRRDYWVNAFAFTVAALYWWHPFVWWARRELLATEEQCCDALALHSGRASRRCYAETLFKALEFSQPRRPLPAFASGFSKGPYLRRRFAMLTNTTFHHQLDWWNWAPIMAIAAILPCVPVEAEQEGVLVDQESRVEADEDLNLNGTQLWRLQDPSGIDYYVEMKGFEGRVVEYYKYLLGFGRVLSADGNHDAVYSFEMRGGNLVPVVRTVDEMAQDDGPLMVGWSLNPEINGPALPPSFRAFGVAPNTWKSDGSWFKFSVNRRDGTLVVQDMVSTELAEEIRRRAPDEPFPLFQGADAWRIIVTDVQRPSTYAPVRVDTEEGETPSKN